MNDATQVESSRALVPATREETKSLVTSVVKAAVAGTGGNIGVSTNWLVKQVEGLSLKREEGETLLMVRTDLNGSLPSAVKFLNQGLSVDDVYGCYYTQRSLASSGISASVKKITLLIRHFAEADPSNEGLDEIIAEAHEVIKKRYFWVKYVDQSIYILCAIAEEYGCATIDGALAMVDSRHAQRDSVFVNDDDDQGEGSDDDVERQRAQWKTERARRQE